MAYEALHVGRPYFYDSGPGPGLVTLFLMGFLASSSFPEKHGKNEGSSGFPLISGSISLRSGPPLK